MANTIWASTNLNTWRTTPTITLSIYEMDIDIFKEIEQFFKDKATNSLKHSDYQGASGWLKVLEEMEVGRQNYDGYISESATREAEESEA